MQRCLQALWGESENSHKKYWNKTVPRFIGYVDGEEKVGIELKENLGDGDGYLNGKFYFKW